MSPQKIINIIPFITNVNFRNNKKEWKEEKRKLNTKEKEKPKSNNKRKERKLKNIQKARDGPTIYQLD